jgi:O-antigen/teichoic acid export membrane protein
VFFVVVLLMGWQGRVVGQIITATTFAFLALFLLFRQGLFRLGKPYSPKNIKHLVHFGVPLIPHTLGNVVNNAVDKLFITNLVGLADTGVYTIGYQFGMIIGLLEDSFNRAYVPWLYEKLSKGNDKDKLKIVRFTYLYFIIILTIAGTLTLLSPFVLRVMVAEEFQGAVIYVFWIALAYAFSGMYKMVVNYIFYAEKTYLLSLVTATKTVLNIVLNYILIKANGPLGAAQATAISFFLGFLMTWVLSARVYKMPWKAGFLELFKLNGRSN